MWMNEKCVLQTVKNTNRKHPPWLLPIIPNGVQRNITSISQIVCNGQLNEVSLSLSFFSLSLSLSLSLYLTFLLATPLLWRQDMSVGTSAVLWWLHIRITRSFLYAVRSSPNSYTEKKGQIREVQNCIYSFLIAEMKWEDKTHIGSILW